MRRFSFLAMALLAVAPTTAIADQTVKSESDAGFSMPILETFDITGRSGPVVSGKIESGSVEVGETLFLQGKGTTRAVKVISIEKFRQPGLTSAGAGPDEVGIEIKGVAFKEVERGNVLSDRAGKHP